MMRWEFSRYLIHSGKSGVFYYTCLSVEYCVQGTLLLYVTYDRQVAEFLQMKSILDANLRFEPRTFSTAGWDHL